LMAHLLSCIAASTAYLQNANEQFKLTGYALLSGTPFSRETKHSLHVRSA
jgi:hypothetical protein